MRWQIVAEPLRRPSQRGLAGPEGVSFLHLLAVGSAAVHSTTASGCLNSSVMNPYFGSYSASESLEAVPEVAEVMACRVSSEPSLVRSSRPVKTLVVV